jgi:hypothetical protein
LLDEMDGLGAEVDVSFGSPPCFPWQTGFAHVSEDERMTAG